MFKEFRQGQQLPTIYYKYFCYSPIKIIFYFNKLYNKNSV